MGALGCQAGLCGNSKWFKWLTGQRAELAKFLLRASGRSETAPHSLHCTHPLSKHNAVIV